MNKPYCSVLVVGITVLLSSCQKHYYVQSYQEKNYNVVAASSPQDSNMTAFIKPYKMGVDTQMSVVIGHNDIPLSKAQPESTLGNFIADAQLYGARKIDPKVDVSIMNYGGIRLPYIAPGAITKGKMYELMPFDNMITIVEIPGEVLKQFCDKMAASKGWPISGMSFVIKDKKATNIMVDGKPLNDHLVYKLVISDYIAKGGDNCDFLDPLRKRFTKAFIRDAMIEYVMKLEQEQKPLHPNIENRISYAE